MTYNRKNRKIDVVLSVSNLEKIKKNCFCNETNYNMWLDCFLKFDFVKSTKFIDHYKVNIQNYKYFMFKLYLF